MAVPRLQNLKIVSATPLPPTTPHPVLVVENTFFSTLYPSLREALKKKTIESLTTVIPTFDPPLYLTALGFFSGGVCFFIDKVVE